MKNLSNLIIGVIMMVIGGGMFLRNITVTAGDSGYFGDIMASMFGGNAAEPKSVTGLMLVLIFTALIITFIKPNVITIGGLILSCLLFVFSIIGGMEITLADMSGLELTIMIGMLLVGLGLSIRTLVSTPKENGLDSLSGLDI